MGLDEVDMNISIEASTTEIPLLQDLGKTLRYMNRGGTSYIKLTNSWVPFDIQLGPWISAIQKHKYNINIAIQNSRKQFASQRKRSKLLWPVSCVGYTSII